MQLNRFACLSGKEGLAFYVPRTKMGRRPMTTAVATRRVRITARKWNRALETFPEAAAIPRTGTRLRHSRVARMAPMRREPFALAAPSASGTGALALPFSRDLEPISWGARICFPGTSPLLPKEAHLSRGTPLSLGWRAVSLPQAPAAKSRLTGLLPLLKHEAARHQLTTALLTRRPG